MGVLKALREGERLGSYEVLGQLGAGGMGEVYLARDTRLGREARVVAALNHPNIVTLHAIEALEGQRVLVMERVTGSPLSALLEPRGLPLGRVLEIAAAIADALSAAHERGVVHRDLKPANVMLNDEGRVKVLDFGLAKLQGGPAAGAASAAPTDTRTDGGRILGTIPYMAPEQLRGQPADTRTDIFALGTMLYEMAAGRRPFRGDSTADVLSAILREEPPGLDAVRGDLPPRFVRLVERCLEKDPRRRVQSATDLRHELQDIAEAARPGSAGAASAVVAGVAARGGRRWGLTAVPLALLALAALAAWQLPRLRSLLGGETGSPPIRSIAVLPFDNLTHDAAQEYFVEGLHDALITELAKLGTLRVTSRNSVMRYKGRALAMKDVARELGVDALVEGSVLRAQGRVRITAQLIQGSSDEHLWADSYDRDLQDVLALLTDVAHGIASQVQSRLGGGAGMRGGAQPAAKPRVSPQAYDAYLRGRQVFRDATKPGQFREAREHFREAIALDPGLAPAWGGLALASGGEAFFRTAPVSESLAVGATRPARPWPSILAKAWRTAR